MDAVERGTQIHTRLAAIARRSTRYELVLVHDDGRRLLLAYGRKTRPGVLAIVHRQAVALADFCGCESIQLRGLPAGTFGKIGAWSLRASGRTEREAIIAGELPRWGK